MRPDRPHRWAIAALATCACLATGCQTPAKYTPDVAVAERTLVEGLGLYDQGEFVLAATRFSEAAHGLRSAGHRERAREATAAECTAWLRARRLRELDDCSERLSALVRRSRHSDPGVNTLIALGAVAGDRPLPPYRVPPRVQRLLRATAVAAEDQ
jgi:hypothetical protein